MKQPAKVSLAGVVLAALAAIFYPRSSQPSEVPAAPPPAVSQVESGGGGGAATPVSQREGQAVPASGKVEPPTVTPKPATGTAEPPRAPSVASGGARAPPTTAAKTPPKAGPSPAPSQPVAKPAATSKVGFTSKQSWLDHFEKHGAEFGKITADEYLAKAQALRDAPLIPTILEGVRAADGVITRFDKKSGAFIAFHKDKSIRTFFRPNDGVAYFKRQLER